VTIADNHLHRPSANPRDELIVAHSSDLHLGAALHQGLAMLRAVLDTASESQADVLVLAGDVFDHNRVPLSELDAVSRMLADSPMHVVILPGNHDCLVPNSVYRRGGLADPDNVDVLGVTVDETLVLPQLDLGVWGRPHVEYENMSPLIDAPTRSTRWHLAVAHGHWFVDSADAHRSWLILNEEISATDADYIALGHWDRALAIGDGTRQAYYSGSPDLAKTINIVTFRDAPVPDVRRAPLLSLVASRGAGLTGEAG
jgi:DNA repair exonuclease SbcCD nuclease subunit